MAKLVSGKIRNVGALVSGRVTDAGVLVSGRTKDVGGMTFPVDVTPVPWTPAEISSDLAAWYSGSDLIMSGADVVGATDLSGNGLHATAIGTGTLSAATWNGILAVVGSETSRGLQAGVTTGAGARAYFVTADRLSDAQSALLNAGAILSSSFFAGVYQSGSGASDNAGIGTPALRVNGSAFASRTRSDIYTAMSGGGIYNIAWASIAGWVGYKICQYGGVGFEFSGRWGDAIFLKTAPTLANAQKIEGYLAWRRGTVAKLPIDHPYKLAPPYV